LLDEATSALDTDTEEKIRIMLEGELAERGMTTIIIAHRLSTVAKAGRIIVMKDGQVVDQGRYEELVQKDRPDQTFRQLAISQRAEVQQDPELHIKLVPNQDDAPSQGSPTSAQLLTETSSATSTCGQLKVVGPEDAQDLEEASSTSIVEDDKRRSLKRFFTLLKSQKWLLTIGLVSGLVAGASLPVSAYMLGQAIYSLSDQLARPSVNTWSLWFMVMAFINLSIFL
jgi:ABC-type glutathione transport system ATPase component